MPNALITLYYDVIYAHEILIASLQRARFRYYAWRIRRSDARLRAANVVPII